ncbi:MAG: single-stranded DNA-binding protein, partial [Isosphaeraceae bacterium]
MAHLNEVSLIGNVGMKPEIRTTKDGRAKIASFSLATTRRWKKDGVSREKTEWHRIKAYGPQAEFTEKYLDKGEAIW